MAVVGGVTLVQLIGIAAPADAQPLITSPLGFGTGEPVLAPAALARDGGPNAPRDTNVLALSSSPDINVLQGGDGNVVVAPTRVSTRGSVVRNVRLRVRARHSAGIRRARGLGWRCAVRGGGTRAACRHSAVRTRAGRIRPISVAADAGAGGRFGAGSLVSTLTWREADAGRWEVDRASDRLRLSARRPLSVSASAADARISDAVRGQAPQTVALEGRIARRTDQPIRYRWRQVCPSKPKPCPRVRWTSVRAGDLAEGQPITSFASPQVKRARTLRFKLTASDYRGRVSDSATVRVLPSEVARLGPRLDATREVGHLRRSVPTSARPVRLDRDDRALVRINRAGGTTAAPGRPVRLEADVLGQAEQSVRWNVVLGPREMLAGAPRSGSTIRFTAPSVPGIYVLGATVETDAGRYERDEMLIVEPAASARTAQVQARAAAQPAARGAFCALLASARSANGAIDIPLESGERFRARTSNVPDGAECTGSERLSFHDGVGQLGSFRMAGLAGTITLERGVVVESGHLIAPEFWSTPVPGVARSGPGRRVKVLRGAPARSVAQTAATGPSIGFALPDGPDGVQVGLGIRLGSGGWEDLAGEVVVNKQALAKLPVAGSLPGGWNMDSIRLGVNPAARRFELSAIAKGPSNSGGDATIGLNGQLTFDGIVRVEVFAANLAVLQSAANGRCGGQGTVSARGRLEMVPGVVYDPNTQQEGEFFPIVDIGVTGSIDCYEPTDGITLRGELSWESNAGLSAEGTLTVDVQGKSDITAEVAGSYTNVNNWDFKASFVSESGLRLGELITLDSLQGSISRSGAAADSRLAIKLDGRVRDFKAGPGVRVTSAEATLTNTGCSFDGPLASALRARAAQTGEQSLCLTVKAGVELEIPGGNDPVKVSGGLVIDLKTLRFSISGAVGSSTPFGPAEFNLSEVTVFATNAEAATSACLQATGSARSGTDPPAAPAQGGLSFGFTAKGRILGVVLNRVAGAYLSDGHYCLSADIGAAKLRSDQSPLETVAKPDQAGCAAPNAPALQGLRVAYSSKEGRARLNGSFCLPEDLRNRLGTVADGTGELRLEVARTDNTLTLDGSVRYSLPGNGYWLLGAADSEGASPHPEKAALSIRTLTLALTIGQAKLDLGLTAAGKLRLPQPSNQGAFGNQPDAAKATEADITLGATASFGAPPSFSVYATASGAGGPGCSSDAKDPRVAIPNLFGQQGLNVCTLGLSGTLSLTPSVAVSASFALPREWGAELGISNASYKLGFSISTAPCVDLEISQQDTSKPAVDLYNKGSVVANKLHLVIAPVGCTLPAGLNGANQQITPGFQLDFDGALFSTPIALTSKLELSGGSFGVDAHLTVGTEGKPFRLGSVEFERTTFDLTARPAQGLFRFHLDTAARFGNGTLDLKADLETSGQGASRTVKFDGAGKLRFALLGATFDGDMSFAYSSSPAGTTPAQRVTVAQFKGHFDLDVRFLRLVVDVENVEYDSTKGGLQVLKVRGRTNTPRDFGPGRLTASGSVDYTRAANNVHVDLGLAVKLWELIDFQREIHVNIGAVEIPFRFGPDREVNWIYPPLNAGVKISGALGGKLTWSPNDGFGISLDNDFTVQGCLGGCVTLAGVTINKQTGAMTVTILGVPIEIEPAVYSGRERPPPDYRGRHGYLISALNSKCLDVKDGKDANQQPIQMYECNQSAAQRFYMNGETGQIRVLGKCVDGGDGNFGNEIRLHECHGGVNQRWYRDEKWRLVSSKGLCLDIKNANINNGARVQQIECKDIGGQRWLLTGELRPGRRIGSCLDTPGRDAPRIGSLLTVQQCDPEDLAQAFLFFPGGNIRVIEAHFGGCVSLSDDPRSAQLKILPCNDGPAQQWVGPTRDGTIRRPSGDVCIRTDGAIGSPVVAGPCRAEEEAQWSIGGYAYQR